MSGDTVNPADPSDPADTAGPHLSEGDLAGYLDRDLEPAARALVEAHLDECPACQAELAGSIRLVDSFQRGADQSSTAGASAPRRWLLPVIGGAMAAGLALVALNRPTPTNAGAERAVRRPAFGVDRARIEPVAPIGTVPGPAGLQFQWRSSPAGYYRFVILTDDGERLFATETADTSVSLPADVILAPGRIYYWRVDAVDNGIVASTGAVRLLLAP